MRVIHSETKRNVEYGIQKLIDECLIMNCYSSTYYATYVLIFLQVNMWIMLLQEIHVNIYMLFKDY